MRQKHLVKVLGLSVLAAIGAMAMSAPAAQAKWLVTVGSNSVSSVNLKGTVGLVEMLVSGVLAIHCPGGTSSAQIKTAEEGSALLASVSATFSGCVLKGVKGEVLKHCGIHSSGQVGGTIIATSHGVGQMESSETSALLEDPSFTEVLVSGELCPLSEWGPSVGGSAQLKLANAETPMVTHYVEINDDGLVFGEEKASLHNSSEPTKAITVLALAESGDPWAIQLVGL